MIHGIYVRDNENAEDCESFPIDLSKNSTVKVNMDVSGQLMLYKAPTKEKSTQSYQPTPVHLQLVKAVHQRIERQALVKEIQTTHLAAEDMATKLQLEVNEWKHTADQNLKEARNKSALAYSKQKAIDEIRKETRQLREQFKREKDQLLSTISNLEVIKKQFEVLKKQQTKINKKCKFCRQAHFSTDCSKSLPERLDYVARHLLCSVCLNRHSFCCSSPALCYYCRSSEHNSALCERRRELVGTTNKNSSITQSTS
jgi:hypothetical protein